MVGRTVSGAHYGVRDWLLQRVSAVIMLLYSLFMLVFLLLHQPLKFSDWQVLFASPVMRLCTLLFALSLYAHAWIGVRDILMDYVRTTWVRLSLQVFCILALVSYSMWTMTLLWALQ